MERQKVKEEALCLLEISGRITSGPRLRCLWYDRLPDADTGLGPCAEGAFRNEG